MAAGTPAPLNAEHGNIGDFRVYDDPDRDTDERPLYERLSEIETGPIRGSIKAQGASIDEIVAGVRQQIERFANGRGFKIEQIQVTPLLLENGGTVRMWDAQVDFEIEPAPQRG